MKNKGASNINKTTANIRQKKLASFALLLFVLLLPIFGKNLDSFESIFFFGFPTLLSFYLIANKLISETLPKKIVYIEIVLIVLYLISSTFSINPGPSWNQFFQFIAFLAILNLGLTQLPSLTFQKSIIIISVIFSTVLIGDKIGLINLPVKELGDNFIHQVWGHSYLADLLVPATILAFYHRRKYVSLFLLFTLFLTNSRSGVLSLIIGLFFLETNIFPHRVKRALLIVLFLGFLTYLIIPLYSPTATKSFSGSRFEYWNIAVKGFLNSPIFGNGPSTYEILNSKYRLDSASISSYAQNSILELLSENGLIFTLVALCPLFIITFRLATKNNLSFSLIIAMFIHSLFDPTFNSYGIIFIFLFFALKPYQSDVSHPSFSFSRIITFSTIAIASVFTLQITSYILFLFGDYSKSLALNPLNHESRMALLKSHDSHNRSQITASSQKLYPQYLDMYQVLDSQNDIPHLLYLEKMSEINPQGHLRESLELWDYYYKTGNPLSQMRLAEKIIHYNSLEITHHQNYARAALIFYLTAINNYQTYPERSSVLIQKSIDLFPHLSHLYIELANIYHFMNSSAAVSRTLLDQCAQYPDSRDYCQKYFQQSVSQGYLLPGTPTFLQFISQFLTSSSSFEPPISEPR